MIRDILKITNKDFFKRVATIAVPATLQYLLGASRNLVDTVMIGKLGVDEVAAVGAAGKPFFVLIVVIFGITSGTGILVSQYWGNKDGDGVSKNIILSIIITLVCTIPIFFLLNIFSGNIISLASDNKNVIQLGSEYLRIISFNLILQSFNVSLYIGLRSTEQAAKCTIISFIGVSLNILFNYILIFGKFGAPAMGLKGAAYGTLISCIIETSIIILVSKFKNRNYSLSIRSFRAQIDKNDFDRLMKLSIPISINGLLWAGGVYVYFIIYGKLGNEELAIMTMLNPLDSFSVSFYMGVATGAGILLGNALGRKDYKTAWYESWIFLAMGFGTGILLAIILFFLRGTYIGLFSSISGETMLVAQKVYLIFLIQLICKSINVTAIVGVIRSGGDTKYVLFLDLFSQWFIGIPLGLLGALVWKLPLFWVFSLILGEEMIKIFFSIYRMGKKKWMNNLIE